MGERYKHTHTQGEQINICNASTHAQEYKYEAVWKSLLRQRCRLSASLVKLSPEVKAQVGVTAGVGGLDLPPTHSTA